MNELAFYQEGFRWDDPVALKSTLLFFDGLAFLVPPAKDDEFHEGYDWLFPFLGKEQLRIIRPEEISAESALSILNQVVEELCHFARPEPGTDPAQPQVAIGELDTFKIGFNHYPDLVSMIESELDRLELIAPSEDSRFLRIDGAFGRKLLHLSNQAVSRQLSTAETLLRPIYEQRSDVLHALRGVDSRGDAYRYCPILHDIATMNIDVGHIPIPELNAFRREHRDALIAYKSHLASVAVLLTLKHELLNSHEFDRAVQQRTVLLAALKEQIESAACEWRGNATTLLTAAGFVKDIVTADYIGMTLSAIQAALENDAAINSCSLSYLIEVKKTFDPH